MRGCVDAMQESPAATIPVLFSAPLKGEPRIVVALRAFFMPAEPARRFTPIIKWAGRNRVGFLFYAARSASELASDYNRIRRRRRHLFKPSAVCRKPSAKGTAERASSVFQSDSLSSRAQMSHCAPLSSFPFPFPQQKKPRRAFVSSIFKVGLEDAFVGFFFFLFSVFVATAVFLFSVSFFFIVAIFFETGFFFEVSFFAEGFTLAGEGFFFGNGNGGDVGLLDEEFQGGGDEGDGVDVVQEFFGGLVLSFQSAFSGGAAQGFNGFALVSFDDFGEGGHGAAAYASADEMLDVAELAHFAGEDEGDGKAGASGAAGTSHAVYVAFGILGHVEVVDVGDAADVEAAGGDVGGD